MVRVCKLKGTWLCPYSTKKKVPQSKPQCIIKIGEKSNCKHFV